MPLTNNYDDVASSGLERARRPRGRIGRISHFDLRSSPTLTACAAQPINRTQRGARASLLAEAGIPPGSRQRCGSVKLRIPIGAGIYRAELDAHDNEPDSKGTVGQVVRLAENPSPLELELYVPTFAQPRRAISFGANPSGRETAPKYPSCLSS